MINWFGRVESVAQFLEMWQYTDKCARSALVYLVGCMLIIDFKIRIVLNGLGLIGALDIILNKLKLINSCELLLDFLI